MGTLAQKQNLEIRTFEKKQPTVAKKVRLQPFLKRILNFMPKPSTDLSMERFLELEAKRSMYSQRRDFL